MSDIRVDRETVEWLALRLKELELTSGYNRGALSDAADLLLSLFARLEAAERFALRVTEEARDGGDLWGCDVLDWATEAGLLIPEDRIVPCADGEACACAEWAAPGDNVTCYRLCPALLALREATP